MEHTPIPDGQTGSWLRKPHARSFKVETLAGEQSVVVDQGYAFDRRCEACRRLIWAGMTWTHQDSKSPYAVTRFIDGEEVR